MTSVRVVTGDARIPGIIVGGWLSGMKGIEKKEEEEKEEKEGSFRSRLVRSEERVDYSCSDLWKEGWETERE